MPSWYPLVTEGPAVAVAESLGIPVITLSPAGDDAGVFTLSGGRGKGMADRACAGPDDVALLLHTSGTTSRPKLVPLHQSSVVASALCIAESLALTESDKCLNVMPLFHVHGLVGALLATIVSGGSVVCTPGFQAADFPRWLRDYGPTWYTAVPTIHQKVLEQAKSPARAPGPLRLRFIRSSSAAMPAVVRAGAGADVRRAGDRGLRDDGGVPPDRDESPAAARPQSGLRGHRHRPGDRHHGRPRGLPAPGGTGRDRPPGTEASGVREQPGRQREGLRPRLVPHGGPGAPGPGRIPLHRRAPQGDHQPGRGESIAPGGRGRPPVPSGGPGGRRLFYPGPGARRERRRRGRAGETVQPSMPEA